MHAQAVVSLWALLEATVRRFSAIWLKRNPMLFEQEQFQKLKIRLGDYHKLDEEDRCEYVIDRLEQELALPLKGGVSRFESLLGQIGISGEIEECTRTTMFEMNQVRNLFLHRFGIVDRKFMLACPSLNKSLGQLFVLDRKTTHRYFDALHSYVLDLILRVGERLDLDMSQHRQHRQHRLKPVKQADSTTSG